MKSIIKKLVPDSMIFANRRKNALKELKAWENAGKPLPNPHIVKQLTIESYQKQTQETISLLKLEHLWEI